MMNGTVLVTGGRRRIGAAIVTRLQAEGWKVLIHSHEITEGVLTADFADTTAPAKLFAEALRVAPDLCAIVNNAALFSTANELPPEETTRLERINVEAPRKLTTFLAGLHHVKGTVVNILDAALGESAGQTPYERSKAALRDWTRKSAALFADTLRVNGVAPGAILPPEGCHVKAGMRLLEHTPTAEDVADAVAYLLKAESVTGVILPVDGGEHLLG